MRETAVNSQEICSSFDTMEFPRVAHIVADLDAMDAEADAWYPAEVRDRHCGSRAGSEVTQAWAECQPFAEQWASPMPQAGVAPRTSQVREVYRDAPALRHTIFARAIRG